MMNSATEKWNSFFSEKVTHLEWFCSKLTLTVFVAPGMVFPLYYRSNTPYPNGLCELLNCNLAFVPAIRLVLACGIALAFVLYLLEKKMLCATLLLFALSILVYSIEESNGLRDRRGIQSMIFLAQFLAYFLQKTGKDANVERNRIQFTLQFIAAAYLLAALSKLNTSGLSWITDAPYVALQVIKSFDYAYFDTGLHQPLLKGTSMATFITHNPLLIEVIFGTALVLELCSFILLFRKTVAFAYALLLLCMHIGILLVMDIFFPTISVPLVIIIINPLYLLYLTMNSIYIKFNQR